VLRRPILIVVALVVAVCFASSALAARVHVRVEGKTVTIFGPTEPTVDAANALEALDAASVLGEFYYHVQQFSFGPFVDQIGKYPGADSAGWSYKVDGVSGQTGADQAVLKDGDTVLWYWADFSTGTGPKTLRIAKAGRCYTVVAQDDKGAASPAAGALVHVGSRALKAGAAGRVCPGKHTGLVWATLTGDVRSNRVA
jgi:Domain of unknown function (DUF4430)